MDLMKKIFLTSIILFLSATAMACPACEQQQPKLLKVITHGAGPDSNWDYVIVSITAIIVLFCLFFSVKWLLRPGEKSATHIKFSILNLD
ncbi:hypothetical protein CPT03_03585 [Pedobacter ginsengisoli]|uniref:Cytochrome c oxidase subunit II n=2 Tax=Pedobacter ginsengisoli TaxID=363852 RepID=A0A2D1U1Z2_9SPHI|nr:hypothetical protein CPT03_03585 [Pedobacter ginsengisoli]